MDIAEGTSVGAVFLDLVVRDTIEKQTAALTQKAAGVLEKNFAAMGERTGKGFAAFFRKGAGDVGKDLSSTLEKSMSGVGKAAAESVEKSVASVGKAAADTLEKTVSEVGTKTAGTMREALDGGYNKTLEKAESRVRLLEQKIQALEEIARSMLTAKTEEVQARGNVENPFRQATFELEKDRTYQKLENQILSVYEKLGQAEENLRIEREAAAVKATATQVREAEKSAAAQEAAAQRAANAYVDTLENIPMPPVDTFGGNILERLREIAKTAGGAALTGIQKLSSGIQSLYGKCTELGKKGVRAIGSLGKSMLGFSQNAAKGSAGVRSFGARLRNIVSGALIFNGLSSALRGMTSRLGEAVTGTAQMKTALSRLQGAAATAAAPLLSALSPALSAIANAAATAFSYIAKLISLLTGKSVGSMQSAAKSMAAYGSSAGGAAKKVKEFEKANNSLGLDELNVIDTQGDSDSGSGGGGGGAEDITPDLSFEGKSPFLESVLGAIRDGDYTQVGVLFARKLNGALVKIDWAPIDATLTRWANNLADGLNGFVDKLSWGILGEKLVGGINTGLHAVDAFFQRFDWQNLGKGLAQGLNGVVSGLDAAALGRVLTDKLRAGVEMLYGFVTTFDWGTLGSKTAEMVDAAFNNIDWATAGQGISGLVMGLLETIGRFLVETDWGQIGRDLAELLAAIDWNGVVEGIAYALGAAFGGIVDLLDGLLGDAWNSLCEYLTEQFSSVGENGIEGLLEGMWNILCDLATWLYEHLIEPLVNGVKDALGIHSPSTVFAEIGEFLVLGLFDGLSDTWGKITGFFSDSLGAVIEKVSAAWESIKTSTRAVWNSITEFLSGTLGAIFTRVSTAWANIKALTHAVWDSITGFLGGTMGAIFTRVSTAWANIKASTHAVWDSIRGFVSGVWNGIRTKCGAAWDSVKEKTLSVWTSLKSGIKSRINEIICVMNGLISGAADMVNRMIDVLNGFSIDVPKWAQGAVGTDRFGFNIPPVSAPQIPMLAQGGYVGPNQPQLAIIGDNRREGEIVAPESKIAEMVAAGIAAAGGGTVNPELLDLLVQILEGILCIASKDMTVHLDGDVLARAVQNWQNNHGVAVGGTFANVY